MPLRKTRNIKQCMHIHHVILTPQLPMTFLNTWCSERHNKPTNSHRNIVCNWWHMNGFSHSRIVRRRYSQGQHNSSSFLLRGFNRGCLYWWFSWRRSLASTRHCRFSSGGTRLPARSLMRCRGLASSSLSFLSWGRSSFAFSFSGSLSGCLRPRTNFGASGTCSISLLLVTIWILRSLYLIIYISFLLTI